MSRVPGWNWTTGYGDVYKRQPKDLPNNQIRIPGNTTVYLAPGAVVKAKLLVDKAENVRIIGRGILDLSLIHIFRGLKQMAGRRMPICLRLLMKKVLTLPIQKISSSVTVVLLSLIHI